MMTTTFLGIGLSDAGPVPFTVTGTIHGHWLWVEDEDMEGGGYWIDTTLPGYERVS